MTDGNFELLPAELPTTAESVDINYGGQKVSETFELNGKKYIYKRLNRQSRYQFENSRMLSEKHPETFSYISERSDSENEAKEEQERYESFCVCFGPNESKKSLSSPAVADTMIAIGNHFEPVFHQDLVPILTTEEKDFIAAHTYQEYIPEILRISIGINLKDVTLDQFDKLRTITLDELDENNPFEHNLKAKITEYKQALQDYYFSCTEAALCGLVPDLHDEAFLNKGTNKFEHRYSGYLLASGVGFSADGNIKWYDFDKPHGNMFSLEQKKKIREAIDTHKQNHEYAVKFDSNQEVTFEPWYIDLITSLTGKRSEDNLKTIQKVFQPAEKDNTPYLDSLRRLTGATRYGE